MLDILREEGFAEANREIQLRAIDHAQAEFASRIRDILEQEPLEARLRRRTVADVIRGLLKQADEKGKAGDVAQYLVGAKLMLLFDGDIKVRGANRPDRKSRSDPNRRLGDFEIENGIIEVAVGLPDEKHLAQVADALEDPDKEVWLVTRADRVATWENELSKFEELDNSRVFVTSVESFVAQNITELGRFSTKGKATKLKELFELYNTEWVSKVGTPGIRITTR